METYSELKSRQQREWNDLPLKAAFSMKQFNEMMKSWDLDPEKDIDKIYKLGDSGVYYKKRDSQTIRETIIRHEKEMDDAIAKDETGEGFIFQMFNYELANHEYCITGDAFETLDALGYTLDEINKDKRLVHGLKLALDENSRESY